MLVKPFYAIDISHWVVRLEIDAQQKDCKAECTRLPLPLTTTVLLTSRVMLRPHRATALLTRHSMAPKQATQADLRYPPPHLRLLNQHCTESPLEACETATSIQQVQTVPVAPASTLNNKQHDTGLSSFAVLNLGLAWWVRGRHGVQPGCLLTKTKNFHLKVQILSWTTAAASSPSKLFIDSAASIEGGNTEGRRARESTLKAMRILIKHLIGADKSFAIK